ncbi:hypothetical protein MUK42_05720 [Musa troglodytarum]|uniref:Uncharacterized protein n=1 Tax=Musa troglodytarum TaxID=320322 RepID=A0A9E7EK06_9LILI|nr:hypothetical protein MUK42_05720 [Musa troglodytarum]
MKSRKYTLGYKVIFRSLRRSKGDNNSFFFHNCI